MMQGNSAQQMQPQFARRQTLNWVLIIAIVVVMVTHLFTLEKSPPVFVDEAWLSNAAWTWLKTGVNFDAMHTGVLDQFGYQWVSRFFVGEAPYMLSFGILGLGIFQARLVSWVFGIVLILATIQVSRRTYGLTTGLLAALFIVLSLPFLQASRWRQDIMLTAFTMLSLWFALIGLQDKKTWAHFVAGFLLGVGMDIHQSAILFIPALGGLYLFHYGRQIIFKRGTWIVAIGGAIGLAIFLAIHVLPNSEVYSKLMSFNFTSGAEAELPITHLASLPSSFLGEFKRYGFKNNLPEFGLIVLGTLWLLWRHSKNDLLILIFTGIGFADFVLLSGNKTDLYAIHLYPLFMLIVAAFFTSLLWNSGRSRLIQQIGAAALVVYIGFSVFMVGRDMTSTPDYDYAAVTDQIREILPPGARVMAMPQWWFGLADYDFRSSLSLPYYEFFNGYDPQEALAQIHPDYIVVDNSQLIILVDSKEETLTPGTDAYKVLRKPFMDFLNEHGTIALEFEDPYYGGFMVFAIGWGDTD